MAKRLIERMSSIIIDQECVDYLLELVEFKIKENLTLKQRRLLSKQKSKKSEPQKKGSNRKKIKDSGDYDDDAESDQDEENDEDMIDDENEETSIIGEDSSSTTDTAVLLRHVDDDGEKGLQLLHIIFNIHNPSYGFINSNTYGKLYSFLAQSRLKDHIVTQTMRMMSNFFTTSVSRDAKQSKEFNRLNYENLDRLLKMCKNGKPKHAKYAVKLIFNCFEKPKNEDLLYDLYKVGF
jgi:hypothetical protein